MSTQKSGQNPNKQSSRSVPPPPPPAAASRGPARRESMEDLLDDFIARANQKLSSEKSRGWDLKPPEEELDLGQIIADEPPAAVHTAPPVAAPVAADIEP